MLQCVQALVETLQDPCFFSFAWQLFGDQASWLAVAHDPFSAQETVIRIGDLLSFLFPQHQAAEGTKGSQAALVKADEEEILSTWMEAEALSPAQRCVRRRCLSAAASCFEEGCTGEEAPPTLDIDSC